MRPEKCAPNFPIKLDFVSIFVMTEWKKMEGSSIEPSCADTIHLFQHASLLIVVVHVVQTT